MDHHVPWPVTVGLRSRGIDILTAEEDDANRLPDPLLLDRAGAIGRVLGSQDRDLIIEARRRQDAGIHFAGLIWGTKLSHTVARRLDDLELIATSFIPEEFISRIEFIPI
jgi:hypothetical protein